VEKTMTQRSLAIGRLPQSPIGPLWVAASETGLVAVDWEMSFELLKTRLLRRFPGAAILPNGWGASAALEQLDEYLAGKRRHFYLTVEWTGMGRFQRLVLQATASIPYGKTATYSEIARKIERPRAARAVGRAEATNPMPLVLPCHRVVGMDGKLHGYGGPGGTGMKLWLLELEAAHR
jgi:methylated-DNA-[protein]-cysteine S-methyltransferase